MSGWRLAVHASAWYWLYPASMVVTFIMSWFLLNTDPSKRILAARWFIVIGSVWVGPGIVLLSNVLSGAAGIGIYLATASSAAILLGGLLQISHSTKELSLVEANSTTAAETEVRQ